MNKLALSNFNDLQGAAKAMSKSGYFTDTKEIEQAVVKVLAGAELGVGPFASMTGIHIIKGKPALGANMIASLIKNDPRYNYVVEEHTDKVCKIAFYEDGKKVGESEFSAEDAKKAGTQNMQKFPRNMLFARAISNGAKWHTPGIFGGAPIYTPEELGATVDEDGDIVDVTPVEVVPEPQPTPVNGNRTLASGALDAICDAGLAENTFAATNALKKSDLTGKVSIDQSVAWMRDYRGARDEGSDSDEAAKIANFNLPTGAA